MHPSVKFSTPFSCAMNIVLGDVVGAWRSSPAGDTVRSAPHPRGGRLAAVLIRFKITKIKFETPNIKFLNSEKAISKKEEDFLWCEDLRAPARRRLPDRTRASALTRPCLPSPFRCTTC